MEYCGVLAVAFSIAWYMEREKRIVAEEKLFDLRILITTIHNHKYLDSRR